MFPNHGNNNVWGRRPPATRQPAISYSERVRGYDCDSTRQQQHQHRPREEDYKPNYDHIDTIDGVLALVGEAKNFLTKDHHQHDPCQRRLHHVLFWREQPEQPSNSTSSATMEASQACQAVRIRGGGPERAEEEAILNLTLSAAWKKGGMEWSSGNLQRKTTTVKAGLKVNQKLMEIIREKTEKTEVEVSSDEVSSTSGSTKRSSSRDKDDLVSLNLSGTIVWSKGHVQLHRRPYLAATFEDGMAVCESIIQSFKDLTHPINIVDEAQLDEEATVSLSLSADWKKEGMKWSNESRRRADTIKNGLNINQIMIGLIREKTEEIEVDVSKEGSHTRNGLIAIDMLVSVVWSKGNVKLHRKPFVSAEFAAVVEVCEALQAKFENLTHSIEEVSEPVGGRDPDNQLSTLRGLINDLESQLTKTDAWSSDLEDRLKSLQDSLKDEDKAGEGDEAITKQLGNLRKNVGDLKSQLSKTNKFSSDVEDRLQAASEIGSDYSLKSEIDRETASLAPQTSAARAVDHVPDLASQSMDRQLEALKAKMDNLQTQLNRANQASESLETRLRDLNETLVDQQKRQDTAEAERAEQSRQETAKPENQQMRFEESVQEPPTEKVDNFTSAFSALSSPRKSQTATRAADDFSIDSSLVDISTDQSASDIQSSHSIPKSPLHESAKKHSGSEIPRSSWKSSDSISSASDLPSLVSSVSSDSFDQLWEDRSNTDAGDGGGLVIDHPFADDSEDNPPDVQAKAAIPRHEQTTTDARRRDEVAGPASAEPVQAVDQFTQVFSALSTPKRKQVGDSDADSVDSSIGSISSAVYESDLEEEKKSPPKTKQDEPSGKQVVGASSVKSLGVNAMDESDKDTKAARETDRKEVDVSAQRELEDVNQPEQPSGKITDFTKTFSALSAPAKARPSTDMDDSIDSSIASIPSASTRPEGASYKDLLGAEPVKDEPELELPQAAASVAKAEGIAASSETVDAKHESKVDDFASAFSALNSPKPKQKEDDESGSIDTSIGSISSASPSTGSGSTLKEPRQALEQTKPVKSEDTEGKPKQQPEQVDAPNAEMAKSQEKKELAIEDSPQQRVSSADDFANAFSALNKPPAKDKASHGSESIDSSVGSITSVQTESENQDALSSVPTGKADQFTQAFSAINKDPDSKPRRDDVSVDISVGSACSVDASKESVAERDKAVDKKIEPKGKSALHPPKASQTDQGATISLLLSVKEKKGNRVWSNESLGQADSMRKAMTVNQALMNLLREKTAGMEVNISSTEEFPANKDTDDLVGLSLHLSIAWPKGKIKLQKKPYLATTFQEAEDICKQILGKFIDLTDSGDGNLKSEEASQKEDKEAADQPDKRSSVDDFTQAFSSLNKPTPKQQQSDEGSIDSSVGSIASASASVSQEGQDDASAKKQGDSSRVGDIPGVDKAVPERSEENDSITISAESAIEDPAGPAEVVEREAPGFDDKSIPEQRPSKADDFTSALAALNSGPKPATGPGDADGSIDSSAGSIASASYIASDEDMPAAGAIEEPTRDGPGEQREGQEMPTGAPSDLTDSFLESSVSGGLTDQSKVTEVVHPSTGAALRPAMAEQEGAFNAQGASLIDRIGALETRLGLEEDFLAQADQLIDSLQESELDDDTASILRDTSKWLEDLPEDSPEADDMSMSVALSVEVISDAASSSSGMSSSQTDTTEDQIPPGQPDSMDPHTTPAENRPLRKESTKWPPTSLSSLSKEDEVTDEAPPLDTTSEAKSSVPNVREGVVTKRWPPVVTELPKAPPPIEEIEPEEMPEEPLEEPLPAKTWPKVHTGMPAPPIATSSDEQKPSIASDRAVIPEGRASELAQMFSPPPEDPREPSFEEQVEEVKEDANKPVPTVSELANRFNKTLPTETENAPHDPGAESPHQTFAIDEISEMSFSMEVSTLPNEAKAGAGVEPPQPQPRTVLEQPEKPPLPQELGVQSPSQPEQAAPVEPPVQQMQLPTMTTSQPLPVLTEGVEARDTHMAIEPVVDSDPLFSSLSDRRQSPPVVLESAPKQSTALSKVARSFDDDSSSVELSLETLSTASSDVRDRELEAALKYLEEDPAYQEQAAAKEQVKVQPVPSAIAATSKPEATENLEPVFEDAPADVPQDDASVDADSKAKPREIVSKLPAIAIATAEPPTQEDEFANKTRQTELNETQAPLPVQVKSTKDDGSSSSEESLDSSVATESEEGAKKDYGLAVTSQKDQASKSFTASKDASDDLPEATTTAAKLSATQKTKESAIDLEANTPEVLGLEEPRAPIFDSDMHYVDAVPGDEKPEQHAEMESHKSKVENIPIEERQTRKPKVKSIPDDIPPWLEYNNRSAAEEKEDDAPRNFLFEFTKEPDPAGFKPDNDDYDASDRVETPPDNISVVSVDSELTASTGDFDTDHEDEMEMPGDGAAMAALGEDPAASQPVAEALPVERADEAAQVGVTSGGPPAQPALQEPSRSRPTTVSSANVAGEEEQMTELEAPSDEAGTASRKSRQAPSVRKQRQITTINEHAPLRVTNDLADGPRAAGAQGVANRDIGRVINRSFEEEKTNDQFVGQRSEVSSEFPFDEASQLLQQEVVETPRALGMDPLLHRDALRLLAASQDTMKMHPGLSNSQGKMSNVNDAFERLNRLKDRLRSLRVLMDTNDGNTAGLNFPKEGTFSGAISDFSRELQYAQKAEANQNNEDPTPIDEAYGALLRAQSKLRSLKALARARHPGAV